MTMITIMAILHLHTNRYRYNNGVLSIPMVLNPLKRKSSIATYILTFIHERK